MEAEAGKDRIAGAGWKKDGVWGKPKGPGRNLAEGRTLLHLKMGQAATRLAPRVARVVVARTSNNTGIGIRLFLYRDVPRLRFHNDGIPFPVVHAPSKIEPYIAVHFKDSEEPTIIKTSGVHSDAILAKFLEIAGVPKPQST